MKLEDFLVKEYNYNPDIKRQMQTYIDQWKSWYAGNVKDFHNYFIYNGKRKVNKHRYTMNMAKEISEEWSDILWSEKCKITVKDENSQKQFEELVDALDLNSLINQSIEKSGALGTESAVVSVYDIVANEDGMYLDVSDAKTRVDLVDIDWIYPLSWDNKEITECAFGSVAYKEGKKYVVLSVHKLADNGNYIIHNHLFRDNNGQLSEITEQEGTMKEFDTKSNVKWFSIFKPTLTNNICANSPFGIPHYANAIDNLKAVDLAFDALQTEINNGKRRTFVRADMLSYDDGTQKMVFDENDTSIYVIPKGATKDDLIQDDNKDLRTDKQITTLNTCLNILGNKVGYEANHYTYGGNNLTTATAVISANSKMFRRKKKLEIGYESAIFDLANAIAYASTKFGKYNINTDGLVIEFDDSIIEDKEAQSNRALREVSAGLISKQEYREKIFGETPKVAEQAIAKIMENEPNIDDLLGTRGEE